MTFFKRLHNCIMLVCTVSTLLCFSSYSITADSENTISKSNFEKPTNNYLPKTWMHAMNGNLSKPGFDGDFKAMNEAGIGGAIFFHVHRRNKPFSSRGPIRFGSEAFFDHLVHAASAAQKNNIEFGVHNADGWTSSGGPWVTPEMSMKRITWSEQTVKGGKRVVPPQPGYAEGLYSDVAVIALPENRYNQNNAFANAKFSSSFNAHNADLLADSDWDTEISFITSEFDTIPQDTSNEEYWVQVEVDTPTTLRSLQIETPTRFGEAALQISDDGKTFTTVVEKLRRPRTGARMWAFSPQLVSPDQDGYTAKYFRFVFDKPIILKRFDLWSVPRFSHWLSMNSMERGRLSLTPTTPKDAQIKLNNVLVLNRGALPENGIDVPKGNWRLLRFGYTSTGAFNVPATVEGEGLEVDKFDAKALEFHFDQFVGKLVKQARAKGINSIKTTEIDSYEVGGQNWTQGFEKSFKQKFNYDLVQWLPVITGRVIESPEHSGAVMQEFRQHQSDLMVENYFGAFTRLTQKYGLESYIEPYGWGPFDELAAGGKADRVMGEFWVRDQVYNGRVMAAISSGRIYGKKIISAESFTSINTVNWYGHPYFYKHYGDKMWARGINETMFHRFAHQPNNFIKPGMTMDSIGSHIDRTQTWWNNGGSEWFSYLARGSYLLQQGVPDSDFLIHLGDVAPLRVGNGNNTGVPDGFGYDYTNTDVLLNRVKVKDGYLVLPEGTRYRALQLHRTEYLHLKTLKRVQELVAQGATVIGNKPKKVVGYSEWQGAQEFKRIADELWGNGDEAIRQYKKGRISSWNLEQTIEKLGYQADVKINDKAAKFFAHRRIGDNDLYYFYNDQPSFTQMKVDLLEGDGKPEIWNIDDGSVEEVTQYKREGKRLVTSLALEPFAGRFLLIRRDNDIPKYDGKHSQLVKDIYLPSTNSSIETLKGPWQVEFDKQWAGPGKVVFEQLIDWISHKNEDVKFYSGTAEYSKTFNIENKALSNNESIYIDLGDVQKVAEVYVNGKALGTLWKPPFAIDVKSALQPGNNELTVKITNTWVNRLIGDEALPDTNGYKMVGNTVSWLNNNEPPPPSERVTFTGFNFFSKDKAKKLDSSGLLGPVSLVFVNNEN